MRARAVVGPGLDRHRCAFVLSAPTEQPMRENAPPRQLAFDLPLDPRYGREDFLVGPANEAAYALVEAWPDWPDSVLVLTGPSGSGKSTILRAIAGLLKPHKSRIVAYRRQVPPSNPPVINEIFLTDTASGICVPTHKRAIHMVTQNASLFPHLNVEKNIQYQFPRAHREADQKRIFDSYLGSIYTLCRVRDLLPKMPSQLSGGERQRVALARALAAPACKLLLLDETFSGLDMYLRDQILSGLRAWLVDVNRPGHTLFPVISVTHDISEAFLLNAEVIRLQEGKITAQGPATEVLGLERHLLLAKLKMTPKDSSA